MPRVLQACEDGQMGEPEACRICGISPEILWDHPELAVRCVRVQFTGPSDPDWGPQAAWFCDTHSWLGLKYAPMGALAVKRPW
jgi:hypothetical protein